jgi:hypothetical protein
VVHVDLKQLDVDFATNRYTLVGWFNCVLDVHPDDVHIVQRWIDDEGQGRGPGLTRYEVLVINR